jgi:hypothetical protein
VRPDCSGHSCARSSSWAECPWMKTGRSSCGRGAPFVRRSLGEGGTPRGMHWETEDSGVRAPRPHPTYPRVFSRSMARREKPRLASIVGESSAAPGRASVLNRRRTGARSRDGRCKPIAHAEARRRGGGPLAPPRAAFLGPGGRTIGGKNMAESFPDQDPLATGLGLRVSATPRDNMPSVAKKPKCRIPRPDRHRLVNTPASAACGSRQEKPGVKIFCRILYGKVPAVRLRTWPHLAADDDHPARKDEFSLRQRRRQRRTVAIGSGQPPRDGFFAASAAGDVMER